MSTVLSFYQYVYPDTIIHIFAGVKLGNPCRTAS